MMLRVAVLAIATLCGVTVSSLAHGGDRLRQYSLTPNIVKQCYEGAMMYRPLPAVPPSSSCLKLTPDQLQTVMEMMRSG